MHQIWIIVNENNKINYCWEAPDPSSPDKENEAPITLDPMPTNWRIIKIKEPTLLKQFQEEAQNKKKTLSQLILDECEIDDKTKPVRPPNLATNIDFKEIKRK